MTIKTERAAEREFSVFEVQTNKFMNLDYTFNLGFPSDPKPYEEKLPEKGFTYEECERFIIHQQGDKKLYSIHNIKQPYFLLDFHIKTLRNQFEKDQEKSQAEFNRINEEKTRKAKEEREAKLNLKSRFVSNVQSWHEKVNSKETSLQGKYNEVLKQKPQMKDYGLTVDDFNQGEVNSFLVKHNLL